MPYTMSISPVSGVPRRVAVLLVLLGQFLTFPLDRAVACSCSWRGPFLSVFRDAPLVVHGRVLRHHTGQHPSMDVLVLDTLAGGLLDSGMRVQMGDGVHCRPEAENFPVGSEWILAINGPGSKPGKDLALSHCGEYWLRVEGDEVSGCIDGPQGEVRVLPMSGLRQLMRFRAFQIEFSGTVLAGQRFSKAFGPGFEFVLEPTLSGWEIVVRQDGRDENLARMTPPLHFAPNPRDLEAWQLVRVPAFCARPYEADIGPPQPREFIFSPEVGLTIAGPHASRAVTPDDIVAVRRFGRGTFTIERVQVSDDEKGCPRLKEVEFTINVEGGHGSLVHQARPR